MSETNNGDRREPVFSLELVRYVERHERARRRMSEVFAREIDRISKAIVTGTMTRADGDSILDDLSFALACVTVAAAEAVSRLKGENRG